MLFIGTPIASCKWEGEKTGFMRMRNVRVLTQMTNLSLRGWWHSKVIPHPCQSASETNQRCFPPPFSSHAFFTPFSTFHPDETIRHSEPRNETQSCLVVFFIIYYSFLSGLIWFVILSFCWYLNYQKGRGDLTKLREYLRGKTAYFHLAAWSVPLVLCIIISGMSKVWHLKTRHVYSRCLDLEIRGISLQKDK